MAKKTLFGRALGGRAAAPNPKAEDAPADDEDGPDAVEKETDPDAPETEDDADGTGTDSDTPETEDDDPEHDDTEAAVAAERARWAGAFAALPDLPVSAQALATVLGETDCSAATALKIAGVTVQGGGRVESLGERRSKAARAPLAKPSKGKASASDTVAAGVDRALGRKTTG